MIARVRAREIYLIGLWLAAAVIPLSQFTPVPVWLRDFVNYWFAPRALWSGVNPYDVVEYRDLGLTYFPAANPFEFNFTYPPHALFLFGPFALFPPTVAYVLWDIASVVAFYLAARPLLPRGFLVLVAVLSPATLICLRFGQTGLMSAALFLLAFRGSGLAAAALTFKPHLGILVVPGLLLQGRRPFLIAVAATLALVAVSAVVVGHWADFFDHAFGYQGRLLAGGSDLVWQVFGTTPMIGYGVAGLIFYGLVAAIVLSRNFNVFTAATATFLISPYGFHYDMAAVCLGFAVLLYSYWDEMPLWQKSVATLAYLTPVVVGLGAWLIPPILLAGLFIQTQWFAGVRLRISNGRLATSPSSVVQSEPRDA